MMSTRQDGSPCGKWSWSQNGDPQSVDYGACWDDGGNTISNCVIGCNSSYPGGGGYVGPWGAGGGTGCISDPSNCVAYQGPAQPGKPCIGGGGNSGHAIGDALDGKPDSPPWVSGSASNEVSQIYRVQGTIGNTSNDIAFVYHTFNNENFIQPVTVPGVSTITIRAADGSAIPNTATIKGDIGGPKDVFISALNAFLNQLHPTATSYACFSPAWNGAKPTSNG